MGMGRPIGHSAPQRRLKQCTKPLQGGAHRSRHGKGELILKRLQLPQGGALPQPGATNPKPHPAQGPARFRYRAAVIYCVSDRSAI